MKKIIIILVLSVLSGACLSAPFGGPILLGFLSKGKGTGYFVALQVNSTQAYISKNGGATWSSTSLPFMSSWMAATSNGSRIVAVSSSGGGGSGKTAVYSDDGTNWSDANLTGNNSYPWQDVCWDGTNFLAISNSGSGSVTSARSSSGSAWTISANLPSPGDWTGCVGTYGVFVIYGTGTTGYVSTDHGVSWSSTTLPSANGVTRYSHAATDGVNIYLQARPFGYSAKSSNGGTSWTQQTSWPTYSGTSGLKCIGNSGNIIVSDVSDGLIYQSVNGGTSFNGYSLPRSLGTDTISANANNVIVGGNNGVSFYVEYSSNGGSSYNETTIGVGGPTLIFGSMYSLF